MSDDLDPSGGGRPAVRRYLTKLGQLTAHPATFALFAAYVLAWLWLDRQTLFDWRSVATLGTWLMTLFVRRTEHRDTQAIQAKLDELLRADSRARNELTRLDEQDPEEIERHRREVR